MKIQKTSLHPVALAVIVGLALLDHLRSQPKPQSETAANPAAAGTVSFNSASASSNVTPVALPTKDVGATLGEADIAQKYQQGTISKGQAMQALLLLANKKPQDFYGKVIDQDGNPLVGVSVVGELVLNDGTYGGIQTQKHNATTDNGGLFEFTGLHGARFGIILSKPGYQNEWKNDAYQNPNGGQSSPADRAIYRMWSTNIHEQLVTGRKSFSIKPDGRSYVIDLAEGTIAESGDGDLKVSIKYATQVVRGQTYGWSCEIVPVGGGLLEEADLNKSMYVAPPEGYTPSFQLQQQIKGGQSGSIGTRRFYVKLKNGQEYGRITIEMDAPYNDQVPGRVRVQYALNPSGSRVLR